MSQVDIRSGMNGNGKFHQESPLILNFGVADLDGTLIDTTKHEAAATRFVLGRYHGVAFSIQNFYEVNGMGHMFSEIVNRYSLPIPGLHLRRQIHYVADKGMGKRIPLVDGAEEFLEECKSNGIALGVATSNFRPNMFSKIERSELYPYFSSYAAGDEVRNGKPDPETYQLAMYRLGARPDQTFAVGDTIFDARSALDAGIPKVFILENRIVPIKGLPREATLVDGLPEVTGYLRSQRNQLIRI